MVICIVGKSSVFHCTSRMLDAGASDEKIRSVRAEIGKANNAEKKERNGRAKKCGTN